MASNAHRGPIHCLVTAGPTREKIDDVRDWGNIFSGKTGLDLALALLSLGSVTLLTSNLEHAREFDGYTGAGGMLGVETFRTHAELRDLLAERMTSGDPVDVVAMTAAVADYRPAGVYVVLSRTPHDTQDRETWVVELVGGGSGKVSSMHEQIAIAGTRTPKLVDMFRNEWGYKGVLIKFKLEVGLTDEQLLHVAEKSRVASSADLMVANTLAMARPDDPADPGGAYLISEQGLHRASRAQLAADVVSWISGRLQNPPNERFNYPRVLREALQKNWRKGTRQILTLKLMTDYHCFPLWLTDGEVGNVDPAVLPLTEALKTDLKKWAQSYDNTLNQQYPPDSSFPNLAAETAFELEGQRLWKELQKQLDSKFSVVYYSSHDQKLYR